MFCLGAVSHVISPFGKPKCSVLLSGVRCAGNESRLIDCPANKLSFEIGKILLSHVNVAGVVCKVSLTTSKVMTFPTPTPLPHSLPPPVGSSKECSCPTHTPLCPTMTCPPPVPVPSCNTPLQEPLPTIRPQHASSIRLPSDVSSKLSLQRTPTPYSLPPYRGR